MNPQLTELNLRRRVQPLAADDEYLLRQGILKLLSIKDSDIRLSTLEQCRDAVVSSNSIVRWFVV